MVASELIGKSRLWVESKLNLHTRNQLN